MTRRLRVLILDDEPRWRKEVDEALVGLGNGIETTPCQDLETAEAAIEASRFDLAIVDLSLLGTPTDLQPPVRPEDLDDLGIQFLETLRASLTNRHCAVVVLTGYPTTERLILLLKRYAVYDVLEKGQRTTDEIMREAVRGALRESRAARAEYLARQAPRLTLRLGEEGVRGVELRSAGKRRVYDSEPPFPFRWEPMVNHCNLIEHAVFGEDLGAWRRHARDLGTSIRDALSSNPGIQGMLSRAHEISYANRVCYQFATPSEALGIPFEMFRRADKEDPICLEGPVSRQIVYPGQIKSESTQAFHHFLTELGDRGKALRVLLVAANVDDKLEAVDQEVDLLAEQLRADFKLVGIKVDPTVLRYDEATYRTVKELLSEQSFHLFHYAGHGLHRIDLPEASGLVLKDEHHIRVLTAADLKLMAEKTQLRMAFLSCCLGARTAAQAGRGDFHGTFEALGRSGVPVVLGYRWAVNDGSALRLACSFYRWLSRTFSPEQALFRARLDSVLGTKGRDDPTWISPILLTQG